MYLVEVMDHTQSIKFMALIFQLNNGFTLERKHVQYLIQDNHTA